MLNKKNGFCFCLILVLACHLLTLADEPLANENIDGLYVRSIEQVLRLEPDQIDIGTAALIISEEWSDMVYGRQCQDSLDDMTIEIKKRLSNKNIPLNYYAIEIINDYLFNELDFKAVKDANNAEDLFLHSVLERKRGYCLSLSILYLSIGERLGLDLHGVVVPGHFFVRYDDGRVKFNIETTSGGKFASDEHYLEKFKVPDGDNIYMTNLTKRQSLGCFFNNLGNSYISVNNTPAAKKAFDNAIDIAPTLAEAHMNLGNIYLDSNSLQLALSEYQKSLYINPQNAKTYSNIGNVYLKQKKYNLAINQYRLSLATDTNNVPAYKNMAIAYSHLEMYAQSISFLKRALVWTPDDHALYWQIADMYFRLDDPINAKYNYQKALSLKGDIAQVYLSLGLCWAKTNDTDQEIKAYKKAITLDKTIVDAYINLGNTHFRMQKYKPAIEWYEKAERLAPANPMILYNLGASYSNINKFQKSALKYQKALAIDPQIAEAHNGLGYVLYQLEKYSQAQKHLITAKRLGLEISQDLLTEINNKLK